MELVEIGKNILTSCMNVRPKEQVLVCLLYTSDAADEL